MGPCRAGRASPQGREESGCREQYQDQLDLVPVAPHVVQHHVLGDVLAVLQLVHLVMGVGVEH